jgi:hypothetical protein
VGTEVKECVWAAGISERTVRDVSDEIRCAAVRWRLFAHVIFFGECIACVSRLNFLYALCLGI